MEVASKICPLSLAKSSYLKSLSVVYISIPVNFESTQKWEISGCMIKTRNCVSQIYLLSIGGQWLFSISQVNS